MYQELHNLNAQTEIVQIASIIGDLSGNVAELFVASVVDLSEMKLLRFMQDGVPPHFVRSVHQWLDHTFEFRLIGRIFLLSSLLVRLIVSNFYMWICGMCECKCETARVCEKATKYWRLEAVNL